MNLQSIIITDLIGILILIILMVSSHLVRQRRTPSDRVFTIMCVLTAMSCIADMFALMVDEQTYPGGAPDCRFSQYIYIYHKHCDLRHVDALC